MRFTETVANDIKNRTVDLITASMVIPANLASQISSLKHEKLAYGIGKTWIAAPVFVDMIEVSLQNIPFPNLEFRNLELFSQVQK